MGKPCQRSRATAQQLLSLKEVAGRWPACLLRMRENPEPSQERKAEKDSGELERIAMYTLRTVLCG